MDYVFENYSIIRFEQLAAGLIESVDELRQFPKRGRIENLLEHRAYGYRYVLFKRSSVATIKIIYFMDESTKKVFITDFFPTEMSEKRIDKRS